MSTPIVARTDGRLGDPIEEHYEDYLERYHLLDGDSQRPPFVSPVQHRVKLLALNRLYDQMDLLPIYADIAPLMRRAGAIERALVL